VTLHAPALACVALLSASSPAAAGACCLGATSPVPTQLGPCERGLVGIDLEAVASAGRWDNAGRLRSSSLHEQGVNATLAAGVSWNRKVQLALQVPAAVNRRAAGDAATWGSGVGDARLTALWRPVQEGGPDAGLIGGASPVLSVGVRAPTGRDWKASQDPLFADVTGLSGSAAVVGLSLERTLGRTPWQAGLSAELGTARSHALTGSVGAGRYLGTRWTVLGALSHTSTWSEAGGRVAHAARSTASARLVQGRSRRWRAWVGARADLPVPGLGRDGLRQHAIDAGLAVVR
jgi:hypothetical protein